MTTAHRARTLSPFVQKTGSRFWRFVGRGALTPPWPFPPAEPLPAEAVFALTEIGRWTEEAIRRTESAYPGVCILSYVVMPDHWHLLLRLLSPEELAATPETSSRNGWDGGIPPYKP